MQGRSPRPSDGSTGCVLRPVELLVGDPREPSRGERQAHGRCQEPGAAGASHLEPSVPPAARPVPLQKCRTSPDLQFSGSALSCPIVFINHAAESSRRHTGASIGAMTILSWSVAATAGTGADDARYSAPRRPAAPPGGAPGCRSASGPYARSARSEPSARNNNSPGAPAAETSRSARPSLLRGPRSARMQGYSEDVHPAGCYFHDE